MSFFKFPYLSPAVRADMIGEMTRDCLNKQLYISKRLNTEGEKAWPLLLRHAAISYDPEWLAVEAKAMKLFNKSEVRHTISGDITATIPSNAADILANAEFNKYYMRAICLQALQLGVEELIVMRAKPSRTAQHEEAIGRKLKPNELLEQLRTDTTLEHVLGLGSPNSGLTVTFP